MYIGSNALQQRFVPQPLMRSSWQQLVIAGLDPAIQKEIFGSSPNMTVIKTSPAMTKRKTSPNMTGKRLGMTEGKRTEYNCKGKKSEDNKAVKRQ